MQQISNGKEILKMIKLELKGNLISEEGAEWIGPNSGQIKVETEMSAYFEAWHEWNTGIINAATEIKVALYRIMADALPELVKRSGETPNVVAKIMCSTIGCDIREFREYVNLDDNA